MWKTYYSNGKLLLTGEYVVLDGACSLALPTRFGQSLRIRQSDPGYLKWRSYENDSLWFEQVYDLRNMRPSPGETNDFADIDISDRLLEILQNAKILNPGFLVSGYGYEVETHLDFNRKWGLGTSSTLINNMAQWAAVDAFELLAQTFGGSGYDIACANHNRPILYERSENTVHVSEVDFNPAFKELIYFVYLNKKQDSRAGIESYRQRKFERSSLISEISEISRQLVDCRNHEEFMRFLMQHEDLLSKALLLPKVQESLFPDYEGVVKSLGAWGGDFVLATSEKFGPDYFIEKGYTTVIPYAEMVL